MEFKSIKDFPDEIHNLEGCASSIINVATNYDRDLANILAVLQMTRDNLQFAIDKIKKVYREQKSGYDNLSRLDTLRPPIMLCPFCGNNADVKSEYNSDENHPDAYDWFVGCQVCEAQGSRFYAEAINDMHLTRSQKNEQDKDQNDAIIDAIKSWNRRA